MSHPVVTSIAISPDGQTLASGGWDRTIRIWDTATGTIKQVLMGHSAVTCLAFSPDGQMLACGNRDKTVALWGVDTVARQHLFEIDTPDMEPQAASVCFSPDGQTLACGTQGGNTYLWNLVTLEQESLGESSLGCRKLAFSARGDVLIGAYLSVLQIWNSNPTLGQWIRISRIETRYGPIDAIAITPNGRAIATGHVNGAIHFWNAITGAWVGTFQGHTDVVRSLAFSSNGQRLVMVSGSKDKTIKLWDLQTKMEQYTLNEPSEILELILNQKEPGFLISAGTKGMLKIWTMG
ncbi:WD40 repeat domain-containing protein [Oculatella sp. LEGE 06141]|uniref:WD40 repeat domain-containing protein n=1 Tax=Oculatella sp. LEGE 06141 TaxID=1828648 RepID=UPI001882CF25|nr:WD40 repeat domain-containing protein [Oculatella sp. LEGE 06141]MBE9180240.1 WD40 repeat domain-containing protein [Oculatella sp. LEGE 06141]